MKRIAVLTGSGISAESGLKTFREAGGLWEGYDVREVASPNAFRKNPELVLQFYNERRAQLGIVEPNDGHRSLVKLEEHFEVDIITQNVDDLHERAGSTRIIHLHGELRKARSVLDESYIIDIEGDINLGDLAPDGGQLRPHIVWFGEPVPKIIEAASLVSQADILMVIGTSLLVYPAAGLVDYAPSGIPIFVIDPNKPAVFEYPNIEFIEEKGSIGVPLVVERLLAEEAGL